jgi:hypothetical protein
MKTVLNFVQGALWLAICYLAYKQVQPVYVLGCLFSVILIGLIVRIVYAESTKSKWREIAEIILAAATFGLVVFYVVFYTDRLPEGWYVSSLAFVGSFGACLDIGHIIAVPFFLVSDSVNILALAMTTISGNETSFSRKRRRTDGEDE